MKKLAQTSTATALLLSGATTAMAAGIDSGIGAAQLYLRMGFDESAAQHSSQMQYGFALDYDRRNANLPGVPAAQVNFDRKGFLNAWMNGAPFARRVTLQQAEGEAAAGSTYTAVDYGLLAIGALGVGYGISEVVNQKDTPDGSASPSPGPGATPTPSPGGGLPLPLPLPIPIPSGGLPIPIPSGGLPLPIPLPAGAQLPFMGASAQEREVTPEYQQWLDAGTGGMGDLVLIKE